MKPLTGKYGDFSGIALKAAARGDEEAVFCYLEEHPDWLNRVVPHGRTLLWEAANKRRIALVRALLARGADPNARGCYYTPMLVELSALVIAQERGDQELTELLLDHGAEDDLYAACHRGDLEALERFLRNDEDAYDRPSRDVPFDPRSGFKPVHYAVAGGHLAVLERLMRHGAVVDPYLELLLDWCEWKEHSALEEFLRARLPKVEDHDGTPEIDRPDWLGFPPLVDACRGNHNAPDDPARVLDLFERGADVNVRDHKNKTALHRACQAGFLRITQLLIDHGAELEARDQTEATPLFDAACHGRAETAELMIAAGASVSARDRRGDTPLIAAARRSQPESIAVLLGAGADKEATNHRGQTALDIVTTRRLTPARESILGLLG